MAKVLPIEVIQSISGKIGGKSSYTLCTNHHTGDVYLRREPEQRPPRSQSQIESSRIFAQKSNAVNQWLRDNRPSNDNPQGTPLYRSAHEDFLQTTDCKTFYSYVWHNLDTLTP